MPKRPLAETHLIDGGRLGKEPAVLSVRNRFAWHSLIEWNKSPNPGPLPQGNQKFFGFVRISMYCDAFCMFCAQ